MPATASRLSAPAATAIRTAIALAGGREVCFACQLDEEGEIVAARVVARGDASCVLALPGFAARGEMLVHNHPNGLLEPSEPDLDVAARLHEDGIGFGIVDNAASQLYVVVEVPTTPALAPISASDTDVLLGPDGPVARSHRAYEDRPGQRDMARAVVARYNHGGIALLEAGTGVGKSMGYLIPALQWAHANRERTVVSTNTINLQEQLTGKDLPFLAAALSPEPVRFAMLKGWRNYLCLLRLEQARAHAPSLFDAPHRADLDAITAWADRTSDGSLSDLPLAPRPEVWDEVAAEPDICQRIRCRHYDRCFLFSARRQAAQADVIVVNHHLLMADLAVRRVLGNWDDSAVLPAFDRLIVDEGHHLEDAAASHLGASVTRRSLQRLFARLDRKGRGLLPTLAERLMRRNDLYSVASHDLVRERLQPATDAGRQQAEVVFEMLDAVLRAAGDRPVRLTREFESHEVWKQGLGRALASLIAELDLLADGLRLVRERLEAGGAVDDDMGALLNEMRAVARRLSAGGGTLRAALKPPEGGEETVRWLELKGRDRNVAAVSVPLDLAPILREDLFARMKTVVVTSATLATDGRFDFISNRLGLTEPEVEPATGLFPSPFSYADQAILAIPTDVPAPNEQAAAHLQAAIGIGEAMAEIADGGMFVLLTSHGDVRSFAQAFRSRGTHRQWPLLVHGEDTRDALLRRFREAGSGILIGTASFWEGVDVPGQALRALLIPKLPFRVPTEPLTAAHCEAITARGGDPFTEYMLPHAALRLKQGFGRLIRTATDHGAVVIADPRIVRKGYGETLLDQLPGARRVVGPWDEISDALRRFFR